MKISILKNNSNMNVNPAKKKQLKRDREIYSLN